MCVCVCVRAEGGRSVWLHLLHTFILHSQHTGELWPLSIPGWGMRISGNDFLAKGIK